MWDFIDVNEIDFVSFRKGDICAAHNNWQEENVKIGVIHPCH